MSRRYRLTEQAEVDARGIWLYVASDNVPAADRMIDRLTEAYQRLAANPGIGTKQDQYRPGLRCYPVGNHIIFYNQVAEGIEIYRILHGARHLPDLL